MNKLVTLLFFFLFSLVLNAQINQIRETKKEKPMLLGKVDKNGFKRSHFSWFQKNYDSYLTNDKIINQLKDSLKGFTIKAFFGTWCGDSRKNIPVFYKILDQANFDKNNVEVIALDKVKEVYKQAPNREEKGLFIHRVPTFIFYKDGKEINRITEHPKSSMERDILSIVTNNKYKGYYQVIDYLQYYYEKDSLNVIKKLTPKTVANYVKGSGELNTYGYVMLRAKEYEKAILAFELNSKIFPYLPYLFDSLGEAYFETRQYKKALEAYQKALVLQPSEKNKEHIEKMILKIKNQE